MKQLLRLNLWTFARNKRQTVVQEEMSDMLQLVGKTLITQDGTLREYALIEWFPIFTDKLKHIGHSFDVYFAPHASSI